MTMQSSAGSVPWSEAKRWLLQSWSPSSLVEGSASSTGVPGSEAVASVRGAAARASDPIRLQGNSRRPSRRPNPRRELTSIDRSSRSCSAGELPISSCRPAFPQRARKTAAPGPRRVARTNGSKVDAAGTQVPHPEGSSFRSPDRTKRGRRHEADTFAVLRFDGCLNETTYPDMQDRIGRRVRRSRADVTRKVHSAYGPAAHRVARPASYRTVVPRRYG